MVEFEDDTIERAALLKAGLKVSNKKYKKRYNKYAEKVNNRKSTKRPKQTKNPFKTAIHKICRILVKLK